MGLVAPQPDVYLWMRELLQALPVGASHAQGQRYLLTPDFAVERTMTSPGS